MVRGAEQGGGMGRRRGRPRKAGPRKPSGRLRQEKIGPTPETVFKKLRLLPPGADITMAETLLKVAEAWGIIGIAERQAGETYCWAYCRVAGRPWPRTLGAVGRSLETSENRDIRAEAIVRAAAEALAGYRPDVRADVHAAALAGHFPRWLLEIAKARRGPAGEHDAGQGKAGAGKKPASPIASAAEQFRRALADLGTGRPRRRVA